MTDNTVTGPQIGDPVAYPALQFDAREYLHFVEDSDLTEGQALELLEAIWSVMVAFVDLGFGVHPVQQVPDNLPLRLTPQSAAVVSCKDQFASGANRITATRATRRAAETEDS